MSKNTNNALVPLSSRLPVQLDNLFDGLFQEFWHSPRFLFDRNFRPFDVDISEKEYNIEIEIPGFARNQVKTEIIDGALVVSAKNNKSTFTKSFYYSDADFKKSDITLIDGILSIKVPRLAPKIEQLEIK